MQPNYQHDRPTEVAPLDRPVQQPAQMPQQQLAQQPIGQQPSLSPRAAQQPAEPASYAGRGAPARAQGAPAGVQPLVQEPTQAQPAPPLQQPIAGGRAPAQPRAVTQLPAQPQPAQPQPAQQTALQAPASRQQEQLAPRVAQQPIEPSAQLPAQAQMQVQPGQLQQSQRGQEASQPQPGLAQEQLASSPFVDVLDSADEITVLADLPGFDEEDIQIQATGNTLHIAASRRETVGEEDRPLQRERPDRFERDLVLPVEIDVDEARAVWEDGVCEISLPKSEETKQKSIGFQ